MWQDILHADQQLLLALNGSWGSGWDTFFYWISSKIIWIPLYAAILWGVWRRYGWKGLLWMLLCIGVAIIAADQICNLFKNNLPKFRPSHNPDIQTWVHIVNNYRGGLYGTVSAHAAISFTIVTFTSLLFRKCWYTVAICAWALLVAYSRIYLGMHFPLDLFFGTLLGITLGYGSFCVYRRIFLAPRKTSLP